MNNGKILIVQFWAETTITETIARNLLHLLTRRAKMTPIEDVIIRTYPSLDGKGGIGITAFQPFVESFCALDTYPEQNRVVLLFYSCRHFDTEALISVFKELIKPAKINYNIVYL